MIKIEIVAEEQDIQGLNQYLNLENLSIKRVPRLNLEMGEMINYLTVGGGLFAIARIFVEYIKVNRQIRKISIKTEAGQEIEVQGTSIEEVKELLEIAEKITITPKLIHK